MPGPLIARPALRRRYLSSERGAAALVVVLVLFFIVSLVAAYTSRGMIFEQRTSINQLRSTQALEIGDAGIEWAITKLNSGLVDASCDTSNTGASTFRQRYLLVAPTSGLISAVLGASATCVMQPGTGWVCTCPVAGSSIPTAGSGPFPAFRVYFGFDDTGARPNAIRVTVSACTDAGVNCLQNPQVPEAGKGNASVSALLGLKGAVDTIPAAAVTIPAPTTASPSLTLTAGTELTAYNAASDGSGLAIQAGGTLPLAGVTAGGAPGAPAEGTRLEGDVSLSGEAIVGGLRNSSDAGACPVGSTHLGCSANRMFTSVFGAPRAIYRSQPSVVRCTAGCTSAALGTLAANNPRSILLVESGAGGVDLDASLGSAAAPIALIVEGDVRVTGVGTVVTGLVYSTSGAWTVTGTPRVDGAVVSEVAMTMGGGGRLEVRYDSAVLHRLRREYGSFVRVPGGWRDFTAS